MALLLHLETTTKNCSVSLSWQGALVAVKEIATESYSHTEYLHSYIQQILNENGYVFSQLSAIAVSEGPGSYTGLRIGISTAKGLCYALQIPLISVPTLAVLARQISVSEGIIIPMLDARRMEVFCALYAPDYSLISPTQALIITPNIFDEYSGVKHILGDALPKSINVLEGDFSYHTHVMYPSAKDMVQLSFEKYQQGNFENVAYFEPFYLKDFYTTAPKQIT